MNAPAYQTALLEAASRMHAAPVVTIGNFDGVHLGHRQLIGATTAQATALGAPSVALSFEPHPVVFFGKREVATFQITSPEHKVELLRQLGISHPLLAPFDLALAGLEPEAFVRQVLHEALGACAVHVGYDFNFGKNRAGGTEDLKRHGAALGIQVHVHEAVRQGGEVISSTRVRKALAAGEVQEVQQLLLRPHSLRGVVEPGQGKGRGMGFPTANLWPQAGMMARHGVYLSRVRLLEEPARAALPGITNLGLRPTVAQTTQANAETLILADLGPDADLYGRPIQVELLRFVRPEQKFDSIDALKAQIARDVEQARRYHQTNG